MEPSDFVRSLLTHWVGALVITLLAMTGALALSLSQPAVYEADASGFVSVGIDDPALASMGDSLAKSRATSYVRVAQSRAVADRVIDELGLDTTADALIQQIDVKQPVNTVLLDITARAATPQRAQELADAWVGALAAEVAELEGAATNSIPMTPSIQPVVAAELPGRAVSPKPLRDGVIGLGAGLMLGAVYAVARARLDRRLRTTTEIDTRFGVPVIGSVLATDDLRRARGAPSTLAVLADKGRHSLAAEAFRKLRTNLSFANYDNAPRTILVTSPQQSDGKSTISTNLAAALAVSGQPVVLVDADLRRPTVAESLGIDAGLGLTDVLVGRADLHDVLTTHPRIPGLSILVAGSAPPNPSELLGSQAMAKVLRELADLGTVILDAPPVLPVTDSTVLATACDGVLVAISHNRTLDRELEATLKGLRTVGARVLGVVFNNVPRHNRGGGYYYGYYYRPRPSGGRRKRPSPAAPAPTPTASRGVEPRGGTAADARERDLAARSERS